MEVFVLCLQELLDHFHLLLTEVWAAKGAVDQAVVLLVQHGRGDQTLDKADVYCLALTLLERLFKHLCELEYFFEAAAHLVFAQLCFVCSEADQA